MKRFFFWKETWGGGQNSPNSAPGHHHVRVWHLELLSTSCDQVESTKRPPEQLGQAWFPSANIGTHLTPGFLSLAIIKVAVVCASLSCYCIQDLNLQTSWTITFLAWALPTSPRLSEPLILTPQYSASLFIPLSTLGIILSQLFKVSTPDSKCHWKQGLWPSQ